MSSKMQFQVFYGEYNVMYGPNGVDLSAFKRTSSGIDKPLERSFGSICKWLQRGFHVDPLTHVITVQSLVNWEVESELWELMMIHSLVVIPVSVDHARADVAVLPKCR